MTAVPTINSHYASINVSTRGFALSPGTPAHSSGGNSPGAVQLPVSATATPHTHSPFFSNPASTYQSHFGDFSGAGVNMSVGTARNGGATASSSANGLSSVGVIGGAVPPPPSPAVGGAAAGVPPTPPSAVGAGPTPIDAVPPAPVAAAASNSTNSSSDGNASPIGASLNFYRRLASPTTAPLSRGGDSSHSLSGMTAAAANVKFASPMAVGTMAKTVSANVAAPSKASSAKAAATAFKGGEPRKPTAVGDFPAAPSPPDVIGGSINNAAAPPPPPQYISSPVDKQAINPLQFAPGGPTGPNTPGTNSPNTCTTHTPGLAEAQKNALFALSNSGAANGLVGVSSDSVSPTASTPHVNLTLSPISPTQLTVTAQQSLADAKEVLAGSANQAPLTPLSTHSNGSRQSNQTNRQPVVNVYDPDFKTLLSIPVSQVLHRPHPSLGVSRLVLCRNYSLENPTNCSKGELCKFVHADVSGAARCSIHVNYAWRSLDLCAYPRLPAGDELTVLAPNERPPSEAISSERILITRGSTNWRDSTSPLSHCAHYYFNRMCNRGERCNFIHAVYVDPNVQGDFKRAPAPTAVAPIVSKSPLSPALHRTVTEGRSNSGHRRTASATSLPTTAHGTKSGAAPPPPPPPPPPPMPHAMSLASTADVSNSGVFGFAPAGYNAMPPPPLPPGCVPFSFTNSPTNAPEGYGGSYMMFAGGPNASGVMGGSGTYMPATLVPPPSQIGPSNGVYLLVPTAGGGSSGFGTANGSFGGGTPRSPVSPLGQSIGSNLSSGPVDWSFYGDLDTAAWMPPPSPSTRL